MDGRPGMAAAATAAAGGGSQKPGTKAAAAARDAWIAAAATRVLAASVYRHAGWAAYGLAWIAKKEALELVAERAIPAGERAAAEAAAAGAEPSADSPHSETGARDKAARKEAADAYRRAAVWLDRSARAFARSARFDRAEAAEEERAARAYGRAELEVRGRSARRRAAEARMSRAASDMWADRTGDEAGIIGAVVDELAAGKLGGAGELSQWLSAQAANLGVVRQALAEADDVAAQAAVSWRDAKDGLVHATESAEKEAASAEQRSKDAGARKGMAAAEKEAMRAWEAAMKAARRAIDAATDLGDLEHDIVTVKDGGGRQRQLPPPAERHKGWTRLN